MATEFNEEKSHCNERKMLPFQCFGEFLNVSTLSLSVIYSLQ